MEFVDIAGLVKGASEGEGLGNKFLANIREVDAIAEVVRVFDNDKIIHVHNKIDPSGDVGVVETELILADLETVNKRAVALEKRSQVWRQRNCQKLEIVKKIKSGLEQGKLTKNCLADNNDFELIKDLHLLTLKPILYVYNISDKNMELTEELKKKNHVILDIKTEEDLMEMSEEDKRSLACKAI